MSLWQFNAVADGYLAAHAVEDGNAMSQSEQDEIWAWMQAKEGKVAH